MVVRMGTLLKAAGLLALSWPALAEEDPPRSADLVISSPQSQADLQACVTRLLARSGRVTPVPIPDGVALDFQTPGLFGPGRSRMSFEVADKKTHRELTATYRHPISGKLVRGLLRDAEKRCAAPAV